MKPTRASLPSHHQHTNTASSERNSFFLFISSRFSSGPGHAQEADQEDARPFVEAALDPIDRNLVKHKTAQSAIATRKQFSFSLFFTIFSINVSFLFAI
jgi:hypothetical protein